MDEKQVLEQLPFAYWLHCIFGKNNRLLWKLTEEIGMPKDIAEAGEEILQTFVGERGLHHMREMERQGDIWEKWEHLQKLSIRFLPFFHPHYPEKLKHIPDAPWGIYVKGKLPLADIPSVAIVGARQCSEYGKAVANRLGSRLGENKIPVISGMARGIDGISQMAALKAGGESFAVLGCGVDTCYPRENRDLYKQLLITGGILSEYPPGTKPYSAYFPPRNRIISGLCDVLVVVEAKEKSGTLITVDMALEQGKEVLVVPGRITDALSYGCNRLIKQGAGVLTDTEDIFSILSLEGSLQERKEQGKVTGYLPVNETEKRLLEVLDATPQNIEQIWRAYGAENISLPDLMQELVELCLKGVVLQKGNSFIKKIV